jgi:hypothetical protein
MPRKGWWENEDDLNEFARAMAKSDGFESQEQVVDYYTEPWHWTEEFDKWREAGRPEDYQEVAETTK